MESLREIPKEDKPAIGKLINELRQYVEATFKEFKENLEAEESSVPLIDTSLPGRMPLKGHIHPIKNSGYHYIYF